MQKILKEYFLYIFDSKPGLSAIGIDIKYVHHNVIPQEMNILKSVNPKVIHLIRKNILKTFISNELNNIASKIGRDTHGTAKVPPVKITIPLEVKFLQNLANGKKAITDFRNMLMDNFTYLELYYEDFFTNSQSESHTIQNEVLSEIYDFLNVEYSYDVQTDLKKTNPNKLENLIENYDDVKIYLESNGWGYLFSENEKISQPKLYHEEELEIFDAIDQNLQDQQLKLAIEKLVPLYKKEPCNQRNVQYMGNLLYHIGQKEQALEIFQLYLSRFPMDNQISRLMNLLFN